MAISTFNLFVTKVIDELDNYEPFYRKYMIATVLLEYHKDKTDNIQLSLELKKSYDSYLKFFMNLTKDMIKIKKVVLNEDLALSLLRNLELEKNKNFDTLTKIIDSVNSQLKNINSKNNLSTITSTNENINNDTNEETNNSTKTNINDKVIETVNDKTKLVAQMFKNFYVPEYEKEMKPTTIIVKYLKILIIKN